MVQQIITAIMCHLIGDYVLQTDFLAKTKGENWYHLFIHCALYTLPFMLCFGVDWRLAMLFGTHIAIDACKARWNAINYVTDQLAHYWVIIWTYLL